MPEVQYETLANYLLMAKKMITKFAPKYYSTLAQEMLHDEGAIADVAHSIMMADWKWNPLYRSKKNTVRTKRSYRNQRAIWAIKDYISKRKCNGYVFSLSYENPRSDDPTPLSGLLQDKKAYNPSTLAENADEVEYSQKLIETLLKCEVITNKQKEYIVSYYLDSQTLQEVGTKYGVSREAVRQGINHGLDTFRSLL
jgi:RNA polymerase sigma factor (sigma-70 family)